MGDLEGYKRQVVMARDIMYFFGKQERQSFKMMADMRAHFGKKPFQPITVTNFCDYYGIKACELHIAMQATDLYRKICSENKKNKPMTAQPIFEVINTKQLPYQFSRKTE
jgi:hypothetical protein